MTPGTSSTNTYADDATGSLTTVPNGATGTYDHAAELTSSALSGTTTGYTYTADGQRSTETQAGTNTVTVTNNGAGYTTTYSNSLADMTAATYNGDDLRTANTTTPAGGSPTTTQFTWNTTTTVPTVLMDSNNAYIYTSGGTPSEQVNLSTGAISYLAADSLGSVRAVVNSSGSLVASTSYDAWGNPETTGGLTATTPMGYAGAYTDPTGLLYLLARYYDPTTADFTTVDPLLTTTNAAYYYAGDNPITESDPSGASVLVCGYDADRKSQSVLVVKFPKVPGTPESATSLAQNCFSTMTNSKHYPHLHEVHAKYDGVLLVGVCQYGQGHYGYRVKTSDGSPGCTINAKHFNRGKYVVVHFEAQDIGIGIGA